jgi:hypothetical protein
VAPSPGTRGMARRRTRKCRRLRAGLPVVTFDPGWPGVPTSKCKLTRASSARRRTPMRSGENSDPMIPEFEIASGKRCLYCAESSAWKKSGNRLSTACIFSSSHSSPFGFAMPGIACTPEAFSKSANQLLMGIFQSYSVRALTRHQDAQLLGTARSRGSGCSRTGRASCVNSGPFPQITCELAGRGRERGRGARRVSCGIIVNHANT